MYNSFWNIRCWCLRVNAARQVWGHHDFHLFSPLLYISQLNFFFYVGKLNCEHCQSEFLTPKFIN
jgi:hypothetical protein